MIITSKYFGPTNKFDARVITYSGAGTRLIHEWDDRADEHRNHERAAEAHYAKVMGKDALPPSKSSITTRTLPDSSNHAFVHIVE